MKIEHIAIWVSDLENMKSFYEKYFNAVPNTKYNNPSKQFQSYFLSFNSGCRIELMHKPDIITTDNNYEKQKTGIIHLAFSCGSKDNVHELTEKLRNDGYKIASEARTTGDGYYESIVLDPENNIIEITV